MSRAQRLLDLIQLLRRHRAPVTGQDLATELGISLRTLYRDIATLQAQGADIAGEAGLGYVLRPGFTLPPLMFAADEIEALVLGSRWVAARSADPRLGAAAANALSKIAAVLPADLRDSVDAATLIVPNTNPQPEPVDPALIREAVRLEHKLAIRYRDNDGAVSERTIWPIAIAFFESTRIVAAWCELRQAYRHFRIDRIEALQATEQRYPRRRAVMAKEWRTEAGLPAL